MKKTIAMLALSAVVASGAFAGERTLSQKAADDLKILSQVKSVKAGVWQYTKGQFSESANARALATVDANVTVDVVLNAASRAGIQAAAAPAELLKNGGELVAGTAIAVYSAVAPDADAARLALDLGIDSSAATFLKLPANVLGSGYAEAKAGAQTAALLVVEATDTGVAVVESAFVDTLGSAVAFFQTLVTSPAKAPEALLIGVPTGAVRTVANVADLGVGKAYDIGVGVARKAPFQVYGGVTGTINSIPLLGNVTKVIFFLPSKAMGYADKGLDWTLRNTTDKARGALSKGGQWARSKNSAKSSADREEAANKARAAIAGW